MSEQLCQVCGFSSLNIANRMNSKLHYALLGLLLFLSASLEAQESFPLQGVQDEKERHYAFSNATIYISPDKKITGGTLLIKEGKVVEVGKNVKIPKDAVEINLNGKYIYPSFIELFSNYGLPEPQAVGKAPSKQPQALSNKEGPYSWNEALRSEFRAAAVIQHQPEKAAALREAGFGLVLSQQFDGIARGASTLLTLDAAEKEHQSILKDQAAAHFSFKKGTSTQNYPSSLMGAIALLRQTYYDVNWYKNDRKKEEYNRSLEKWIELERLPQIFDTRDWQEVLRADAICDEFRQQYIFMGSGDEYKRVSALKNTKGSFIIPLNFPKAYDLSDPYDALHVSLADMKHWELAPSNPARLAEAGILFSLSSHGLETPKLFLKQLRQAYAHGLSEEAALAALTTQPAQLIEAEKEVGQLKTGYYANFFISSGNILSDKASVLEHWLQGRRYEIHDARQIEIRGRQRVKLASGKAFPIFISGSFESPKGHFGSDSTGADIQLRYQGQSISFTFPTRKGGKDLMRFSGVVTDSMWTGDVKLSDGTWSTWSAKGDGINIINELPLPKVDTAEKGGLLYPFVAYGFEADELPEAEKILFKNATIWTGEKQGVLENADLLISGGKILKLGRGLSAGGAKEIDATGKHLTAGIIDEHSHIAISRGVNEGTQASSAEVSIQDVVNSEDVNVYRQLAGGVTMAQLLHGSANPIGGQSAIIKFRWGKVPSAMLYEKAKPFIKFALGENVKQSNWGDNYDIRFPQTRMGVEQVYMDYFTRAKEYELNLRRDRRGTRRDLDLEAVLEIVNSERFITCHSYIQSEIVMLMRVAEQFNFRINTFTHILEGYKIADKMKEHGAGGSSFSDWWAYKYEVREAIPYNAKILNKMGVLTAINSDDAEMGRRLNQEAAKMVKYGKMTEEEAWNLVTINPAKLLRIDEHVGSIKEGKEADLVLWSDNPLSIYAKAEQTYVDGVCYFDLERDKELRKQIRTERSRLVSAMQQAQAEGAETQPALHQHRYHQHYHCDTITDEIRD